MQVNKICSMNWLVLVKSRYKKAIIHATCIYRLYSEHDYYVTPSQWFIEYSEKIIAINYQ